MTACNADSGSTEIALATPFVSDGKLLVEEFIANCVPLIKDKDYTVVENKVNTGFYDKAGAPTKPINVSNYAVLKLCGREIPMKYRSLLGKKAFIIENAEDISISFVGANHHLFWNQLSGRSRLKKHMDRKHISVKSLKELSKKRK